MLELHFPWLELTILLPILGALWVRWLRDPDIAKRHCTVIAGLTLASATGVWQDFASLNGFEAHDGWDALRWMLGNDPFVIDELSAPLLPLGALLYFLTFLATPRTKTQRFSFSWALASEAVLLATLSCKSPWPTVGLLALGIVPPIVELTKRRKPKRAFILHMALFVIMLVSGQALVSSESGPGQHSLLAVLLLSGAVLLRSGIVPVHCWMTDLFEHASFGAALLFVTPMVGAYGAMRLVLPIAPDWVLRVIAVISLTTALYAAGMALVQRDSRRFFCYLFLSHSSLVLVGLEIATSVGLTGALCVWLSVGLALAGFGLTLRGIEARTGRLSLAEYHGLYEHIPMLAAFFLLTGLASIGFPGTIGFVGAELLMDGAIEVSPIMGAIAVIAAALNGLAVMHAYFRLFTGARRHSSIDLRARPSERFAVLILTLLILGGGLIPQPGVSSRYHAAVKLVESRYVQGLSTDDDEEEYHDEDSADVEFDEPDDAQRIEVDTEDHDEDAVSGQTPPVQYD